MLMSVYIELEFQKEQHQAENECEHMLKKRRAHDKRETKAVIIYYAIPQNVVNGDEGQAAPVEPYMQLPIIYSCNTLFHTLNFF
jgi:hypothetical protein